MLLLLFFSLENPLAEAIDGYWAGDPVADEFELLYEQRPRDPERAYWLARVRLDEGRCREAADLLQGRVSEGPDWRLRAVEGLAAVCLEELDRAWEHLSFAAPEMTPDPLREQVWSALGVLSVRRDEEGGAEWLHKAGGDPARALPPRLRKVLDDAVLGVRSEGEGSIFVGYEGRRWLLELGSGVARPAANSGAPEAKVSVPEDARDVGFCGAYTIWASPRGIERGEDGKREVVIPARAGFSLEAPQCLGDDLYFLRRGPDGDRLLRGSEELGTGDLSIVSYEVGERGLLLGVMGDQVWVLTDTGPERLVESPLRLRRPSWIR